MGYQIGLAVLVSVIPFEAVDGLGARIYRVPAASMRDTVMEGDFIVADSWAYRMGGKPQRGDVAVVELPQQPGLRYVRRIIVMGGNRYNSDDSRFFGALPGDRLLGRVRVICASLDSKQGLHFDRVATVK